MFLFCFYLFPSVITFDGKSVGKWISLFTGIIQFFLNKVLVQTLVKYEHKQTTNKRKQNEKDSNGNRNTFSFSN